MSVKDVSVKAELLTGRVASRAACLSPCPPDHSPLRPPLTPISQSSWSFSPHPPPPLTNSPVGTLSPVLYHTTRSSLLSFSFMFPTWHRNTPLLLHSPVLFNSILSAKCITSQPLCASTLLPICAPSSRVKYASISRPC